MMISYSHVSDPNGPRFQQLEQDTIPKWATNIKSVPNTTNQETSKELLAQAKDALYHASNILSCVPIKNDYQEKAYRNVLNAWHAINKYETSQGLTEEQKTQLELDCGRDRFSGR